MAKFTDFIPEWLVNFFRGQDEFLVRNHYRIGQKGAVWLDTQKPYILYNSIPQLRKVIDRKAAMFANMDLKLIDQSGKEIEDKDFIKLIKNPNPMQSMNGWLKNYKSQEQIYGNQFMYKNKPSPISKYPLTISNISPYYVKPKLTGKLFDQIEVGGIIEGYEYRDSSGNLRMFLPEEILYSKIEDLDNPIIGSSPLMSLKFPLSNTKLAYEYRNVIMGEMGAPTLISSGHKDTIGARALTNDEKKEADEIFTKDYGVKSGQRRVKVLSAPVEITHNAFPTKELMLFEEVDANEIAIIDHFGLNINIFSGKNQTYENVKNSIIQCYQDTIQVEADLFTQSLGKFIGIPDNLQLVASYEHLSIMKENKQKGMLAVESITRTLTQSVQAGILDAAQAKLILQNELATHLDES